MTLTETAAPPPTAEPAPEAVPLVEREMTMLEHLEELRNRMVMMVLSVVVGLLISLIPLPEIGSLTQFVVRKLVELAPGGELIGIKPGEAFFTYLQVSVVLGIAVAMPMIVYQILAFVTPALYDKERKYLYFAVPGVTLSFLVGVIFCYKFMLPFAINFLGGFAADVIKPQWTSEYYLDFVSTFVLWVGVTFELPIVMYFLAKLGVVSAQRMAKYRRYAFVGAFVLGAVITPTPDPVNQSVVSLPIYFLYELGIILARFA